MTKIETKLFGVFAAILLLAMGAPINVAYAEGSINAEGTFADTSFTILAVRVVGGNTILTARAR